MARDMPLTAISRRALLSTLGALAAMPGLLFAPDGRAQTPAVDPLPSWNEGATKSAIIAFVERVTKAGSPDFVPVDERIATFDNDGTLWVEKPAPVQLAFALDRVKALAPAILNGPGPSLLRRCSKAI